MVAQHDLRLNMGLVHHIAVLRHCIDVLQRRIAEDTAYSWLWNAKLKAALFGLRMLEERSPSKSSSSSVELRTDELRELDDTHPLLQNDRPTFAFSELRKQTDWYRDLQDRVRKLARKWK